MAFTPLGNPDQFIVSVSIDFPSYSQQDAPFYCITYYYPHADWDSFPDHLRDVPWEDIFKHNASAAASEFCEWVRVDLSIPNQTYQVKHHSSLWFYTAFAGLSLKKILHVWLLHSKTMFNCFGVRAILNCMPYYYSVWLVWNWILVRNNRVTNSDIESRKIYACLELHCLQGCLESW